MGYIFFPLTAALSPGERLPRIFCAHCAREPTPSPSQEGSNTGWPVPLLGGVRGGLVGAWFMGRVCAAPCSTYYGLLRMGEDAHCYETDMFSALRSGRVPGREPVRGDG